MQHQLATVEYGILEVIGELNSIEVTSIDAEFAEHTVAKVVLIVIEHLFLLTCLRVCIHVRRDLNRVIRTSLLTHGASRALVITNLQSALNGLRVIGIFHTLENQAAAMTLRDMKRRLTILGILLSRLWREVFLHGNLKTSCQCLRGVLYPFKIL